MVLANCKAKQTQGLWLQSLPFWRGTKWQVFGVFLCHSGRCSQAGRSSRMAVDRHELAEFGPPLLRRLQTRRACDLRIIRAMVGSFVTFANETVGSFGALCLGDCGFVRHIAWSRVG